jgi:hypothetical protein
LRVASYQEGGSFSDNDFPKDSQISPASKFRI